MRLPFQAILFYSMLVVMLTPNFALSEFDCQDGSSVPRELMSNVSLLATNLQVLREAADRPIKIVSGYRSPKWNRHVGGARKSQHMEAKAADIQVTGMRPVDLKGVIERLISEGKMLEGGIGLYRTWVHYDVRGNKTRWSGK